MHGSPGYKWNCRRHSLRGVLQNREGISQQGKKGKEARGTVTKKNQEQENSLEQDENE